MQIERSILCEEKLLMVESDRTMRSKEAVKRSFIYHTGTARRKGVDAEQFSPPCPNLATEDTYGDGGEDDVCDWREDGIVEVAAAKCFVAGVVES